MSQTKVRIRADAAPGHPLRRRAGTLAGGALDLLRVAPPSPPAPLDVGLAAAALRDAGASVAQLHLPASSAPWAPTGLTAREGAPIMWLARGDTWIATRSGPHFDAGWQLRLRTGRRGPALVGTGSTFTAAAPHDGPVEVCSLFPGELHDGDEDIFYDWIMPRALFRGGFDVVVAIWRVGTDIVARLTDAAERDPSGLCRSELDRLRDPVVPPPGWEGHDQIPFAGLHHAHNGEMHVHSRGRVEIICHPARIALSDALRLRWRWRVDQMPARRGEDTILTHDYVAVAAEFDDGHDLAYHWSVTLPAEASYHCPYPHWRKREWHLVVRSGRVGLGDWQSEERRLLPDHEKAIGGPVPHEVARVWLIVNCLAPSAEAAAAYSDIALVNDDTTIRLL